MRTTAALSAAIATSALALSGCSILESFTGTSVLNLEAGDCFLWPNDDLASGEAVEVGTVSTVDCADAHDAEIYHVFDVTDGPWNEDAILTEGFETCVAEFEIFIGMPYETSEIYLDGLTPTQAGWEDGDHEIACYVYVPDTQTQGSLQGAAR